MDAFAEAMWKAYRKTAPEQEMSGKNRQWVPGSPGKWVPNPRPENQGT